MQSGRQSPLLLGSLFTTGAIWVTLAMGDPVMRTESPYPWLVWTAVAAAYICGLGSMALHRWDMPAWLAFVLTAFGSIATTMVVVGGPPVMAGSAGGFYGYVAAYSFLFFSSALAGAQLAVAALAYAVGLNVAGVPLVWSHWVMGVGIAAGGAGLFGFVGATMRARWEAEQQHAAREHELADLRATFLQAVSHELRTPLTAVVGFASTLEHHGDELDDATKRVIVSRTRAQAERLQGLLNDLLDLDRMRRQGTSASRSATHLAEVVANALHQVAHPRHDVRLREVVDSEVWVEGPLLERALVNLLSNAVNHTPPGTRVDLSCLLDGDDTLVVEVADDGPGLPDGMGDELFEPFVQGQDARHRAQPGTGIGLSLVRQMARMHGGEATGENRAGGGALFRVTMPDARVPAEVIELRSVVDDVRADVNRA